MSSTALVLDQQNPAQLVKRETASDVLAAQAKATVQARYLVAYNNRRDWDQVRQRILKDCDRPMFAEAAIYAKPIGNDKVTGLSIRFAESALRAMTNVMPERTVIFDDAEKRIVRIALTDLESNVTHSKDLILEKRIERKNAKGRTVIAQRLNSYGETVYIVEATEDELLVKESAISSKVERQLTLKLLPGDIQEEALRAIRETQKRQDKQDPDAAKNRLVDAFDDLGVRVNDLKAYLGLESLDSMQPSDIKQLREVYAALKEGEATWRNFMDQREAARGDKSDKPAPHTDRTQSLTEKIKSKQKPAEAVAPWSKEADAEFEKLGVAPDVRQKLFEQCGSDDKVLIEYLREQSKGGDE